MSKWTGFATRLARYTHLLLTHLVSSCDSSCSRMISSTDENAETTPADVRGGSGVRPAALTLAYSPTAAATSVLPGRRPDHRVRVRVRVRLRLRLRLRLRGQGAKTWSRLGLGGRGRRPAGCRARHHGAPCSPCSRLPGRMVGRGTVRGASLQATIGVGGRGACSRLPDMKAWLRGCLIYRACASVCLQPACAGAAWSLRLAGQRGFERGAARLLPAVRRRDSGDRGEGGERRRGATPHLVRAVCGRLRRLGLGLGLGLGPGPGLGSGARAYRRCDG
eukprot:scaffold86983_cov50-Phaeocystis_antarctica.AAC.3